MIKTYMHIDYDCGNTFTIVYGCNQMKKYARIVENTVVEVILTDQNIKDLFHKDLVWVEASAEVVEGYSYIDSSFMAPSISKEQSELHERLWRNSELFRADIELNKVQDSDTNSVGSVTDWRLYRKSLRSWPESPDFPDTTKRPAAPDASNQQ